MGLNNNPFHHVRKSSRQRGNEKLLYTDSRGVEFEVTADRKRKLQDISNALATLGLCPLLVHIWEKDGTPILSHPEESCACQSDRPIISSFSRRWASCPAVHLSAAQTAAVKGSEGGNMRLDVLWKTLFGEGKPQNTSEVVRMVLER